jgi:hypothetical protein
MFYIKSNEIKGTVYIQHLKFHYYLKLLQFLLVYFDEFRIIKKIYLIHFCIKYVLPQIGICRAFIILFQYKF